MIHCSEYANGLKAEDLISEEGRIFIYLQCPDQLQSPYILTSHI